MKPTDAIRDAAIENGDRFYHNGKPCRRGHISARYASTGNCVECLTLTTQLRRSNVRKTTIAVIAEDRLTVAIRVPLDWMPIVRRLEVISWSNDANLKEALRSVIIANSSEPTEELMPTIGLDREALKRMNLDYNGVYVTNVSGHLTRNGDEQHPDPQIRLNGRWYNAFEVMDVFKDVRPYVLPIKKDFKP